MLITQINREWETDDSGKKERQLCPWFTLGC